MHLRARGLRIAVMTLWGGVAAGCAAGACGVMPHHLMCPYVAEVGLTVVATMAGLDRSARARERERDKRQASAQLTRMAEYAARAVGDGIEPGGRSIVQQMAMPIDLGEHRDRRARHARTLT